jgi:CheY-like chemotaxis protein
MLHKWGMKPHVASDAQQALDLLGESKKQGNPFRVVLLDAKMPEMEGFELVKKVKTLLGESRIIMMVLSSAGLRGDAQRCRELGIAAYLTKPIEQNQLISAIKLAFGEKMRKQLITRHFLNEKGERALNILLAEDNAINQKLATAMLERWGHHVTVANHGGEAIELSGRGRFDLILMDIQMPEVGGFEATQRIRAREKIEGKHTQIVAMTANAMSDDRQRCLDAGMDDYLSKPLNSDNLWRVLHNLPVQDVKALPPPAQVFDYDAALKHAEAWIIELIAEDFLKESDQQLESLRRAILAKKSEVAMRTAHTLRGLVANFQAQPIVALAGLIEERAEQGDFRHADELYQKLHDAFPLLITALKVYLAEIESKAV